MYALRVARRLYKTSSSKSGTLLKRKYIKQSKSKISISARLSTTTTSLGIRKPNNNTIPIFAHSKRYWQTPDQLSTSELRKECDRRSLPTKGSRTALIDRLKEQLTANGGYDNGLTLDDQLANKKREIETEQNKIPEKHFSTIHLYVEERFQKKVASEFENDSRIRFHTESPSHIKLEGRYADICSLRDQITQNVADRASKETIYSLPHHVVLRLKRSILADIRRSHDVNFTIMRHKHNGEDMMLIGVEGEAKNRLLACDVLEEVIAKIKSHSVDVPGLESYAKNNAHVDDKTKTTLARLEDLMTNSPIGNGSGNGLRESVSDCFNIFSGVILYLDPRMREMMSDYQARLDQIGKDTSCNIYLGNRDLFWLNDFQLAIEGNAKSDIQNARQQVDALLNHLKSLTMTIVLPPSINNEMAKESKQLASTIQKELGVDTVIIQQNEYIYCHLIGSQQQVNTAAQIIDSRTHKLHKLRGADSERLARRERIRTLNFLDYGVGGLDDTLRDMLRRTFESRLISTRLRKELDLQHIRGVLLYGPPGTGKTLVARKISEILGCAAPKIVNGPEVESKWVGEAEKNIRALFEEAQAEFDEKGADNSNLHVIIFDEIDAIAKKRGGAHAKSRDGALNQLLCCLDGVETLDNVLIFGLTNRKDCLDPALLRPGRLEVQLDIGLPDAKGREDILNIHLKTMREYGRLHPDVDTQILAQMSDDFSGADLSGMIRSAVSYALEDMDDEDEVMVTQELLQRGLHEVRFARERMPSDEDPESGYSGLLQA